MNAGKNADRNAGKNAGKNAGSFSLVLKDVIGNLTSMKCIIHLSSVTGEELKSFSLTAWNRVCEFAHSWQNLDGYEAEISSSNINLFQEKGKFK